MKGTDFHSKRTTNSVRLIPGSQYAIGNPTLSHVQLCINYLKRNLVPRVLSYPYVGWVGENPGNEVERYFLPLPVIFYGVSSAIASPLARSRVLASFAQIRELARRLSQIQSKLSLRPLS